MELLFWLLWLLWFLFLFLIFRFSVMGCFSIHCNKHTSRNPQTCCHAPLPPTRLILSKHTPRLHTLNIQKFPLNSFFSISSSLDTIVIANDAILLDFFLASLRRGIIVLVYANEKKTLSRTRTRTRSCFSLGHLAFQACNEKSTGSFLPRHASHVCQPGQVYTWSSVILGCKPSRSTGT